MLDYRHVKITIMFKIYADEYLNIIITSTNLVPWYNNFLKDVIIVITKGIIKYNDADQVHNKIENIIKSIKKIECLDSVLL